MRDSVSGSSVAAPAAPAVPSVRRTRRRNDNLAGYLFIAPWLIGFFSFTLIPMVASLYFSFTDYDIFSAPRWIGLGNFQTMFFQDARYWKSVQATFYYVFTAVPLRLAFALGIAMLLNTGFSLLGLYRAIFYVPSIMGGSVAVALMWRQLFGADGLINDALAALGVQGLNWLGDPRTAIWTLILLAVWQFGSPMLIFLAGLKQIPTEMYEAASIDGAGGWRKFLNITLPLLSPVIFFNLVMQIIAGFMVFTQAFVITNGGPLDTTRFYSVYLYNEAFENFHMGYSSAMAWVLLLIIAFFTALAFRSSSTWVHYETRGE
jgi:multiple sugar transport system permease protein